MAKKLTLRVPEDLIESAKTFAEDRGISVSHMVTAYFRALRERSWQGNEQPPVLRRVTGVLRSGDRENYRRHLEDKYLP